MGGVEGGTPLSWLKSAPQEQNYTPLSEKDLTPLDFFVPGKIFHTVKSPWRLDFGLSTPFIIELVREELSRRGSDWQYIFEMEHLQLHPTKPSPI